MATEIKYESALPQLLTQLLGSKQTNSSSVTANPAATDALTQLLSQQMGATTPAGMQDLIKQVFTTGAEQVPVLTQALANATGTRSSNNSGLQLGLAELNKTLAGQAAQLVTQQQTAAAQTAAQLANASRSTSTTQKTGVGSLLNTALLAGGGSVLNKLDKSGALKKVTDNIFGSSSDTAGTSLSSGVGGFTPDAFGFGSADILNPGSSGFGAADAMGAFDFGGLSDGLTGLLGGGGDAVNLATDFGANFGLGANATVDAGSGILSDVGDLFSGWFADGGLVTDKHVKMAAAYADGGVVRNRNNMGDAPSRGQGTAALNAPISTAGSSSGSSSSLDAVKDQLASFLGGGSGAGNQSGKNMTGGSPDQNNRAVKGFLGTLASFAMPGLAPALAAYSALTGEPTSLTGVMAQDTASAARTAALNALNSGANSNDLAATANAQASLTGQDPMDSLMGITNAFGTGLGDPANEGYGTVGTTGFGTAGGGGFGGRGGWGGTNNSAGGNDGMGSGSNSGTGGNGGNANAADGGHIQGPGTGVSDSIPARLSAGEFVLSKDVVDAVGVDLLQKLQDQFHTPKAVQVRTGVK